MGSNEDNPFIELIKKIFEIKVEGIVLPAFLVLISPSLALLIIGALVFSGAIEPVAQRLHPLGLMMTPPGS